MGRRSGGTMASIRIWHGWLGMLIAPSVIFFSLTGAVQMLNLHEDHAGYRAPHVLVEAAALHKKQVLPNGPGRDRSADPAPTYSPAQAVLKGYWIAVAAALVASTAIGVVLGLRNRTQQRTSLVLLASGSIIPIMLALV